MPKVKARQARESNAEAAAQRYAPKPNGSAATYGLTAASLMLVVAFLGGAYFGVDVASHGWALAGLAILAFVAGCALRVWRQNEHSQAVHREFSSRSPESQDGETGLKSSEQSFTQPGASETVTFKRPFILPGLDRPHSPGTFRIWERREPLDVSWDAYVVTKTLMLTDGAAVEALDVKADDLDEALHRDEQASAQQP